MTLSTVVDSLNNRELSFIFWTIIFAIWAGWKRDVRQGFIQFLIALCCAPILAYLALAIIWTSASVALLASINLWEPGNLKTTALWFIAISFGSLLYHRKLEEKGHFKKLVRDVINITAIFTFAVGVYSFSFAVEFFLVPIMVIAAVLMGFSESQPKYAPVYKLLQNFFILLGLIFIFFAVYSVSKDVNSLANWQNVREFIVPIVLTILFIPFIFIFAVHNVYSFCRVRLGLAISRRAMRDYAMNRARRVFKIDIESLKDWVTYLQLNKPKSREDIDRAIAEWDRRTVYRYDPPQPHPKHGWSIDTTPNLLADEGVTFDEYSPTSPSTWGTSCNFLYLHSQDEGSRVWIYLQGTNTAIQEITARFTMEHGPNFDVEELHAMAVLQKLLERAWGATPPELNLGIYHHGSISICLGARCLDYFRWGYNGGYTVEIFLRLNSVPYRTPFMWDDEEEVEAAQ